MNGLLKIVVTFICVACFIFTARHHGWGSIRRFAAGTLLAIVLFALMGCDVEPPRVTENSIELSWYNVKASVQDVTLKDGTHCAVLIGSDGRSGIDCDWNNKARPE